MSNFEQFLSNFEQFLSTIEQFLSTIEQFLSKIEQFLSKIEQFFLGLQCFFNWLLSNAFSIDWYPILFQFIAVQCFFNWLLSNAFSIDCYLHCPPAFATSWRPPLGTCSKLDLFAAFKIFLAWFLSWQQLLFLIELNVQWFRFKQTSLHVHSGIPQDQA